MKIEYLVPADAPEVQAFTKVARHALPRKTAKVLAVAFALGCLALAFVPWQQTAFGDGQIVAYSPSERTQPIEAPVGGRLEEWHVREGSRVEAGDPIVRIVDIDPALLDRLRTERDAARARLAAAEMEAETAALNVTRQRKLHLEGLSSRRQFEEAQIKAAQSQQAVAGARATVAEKERNFAQQDVQLVKAPRSGIIARRIEGQGTVLVQPGEELALIVPLDVSPAVELWIDGNDLPLVAVGDSVRLQFEGWPALQMSGWPSVAVGTFGGRVDVIDPAGIGADGRFRILIRQGEEDAWPASQLLRQGMRAHGWVLLRQVPLGFEVWRRFNDFPPSRPLRKEGDGGPKGEDPWRTQKPGGTEQKAKAK